MKVFLSPNIPPSGGPANQQIVVAIPGHYDEGFLAVPKLYSTATLALNAIPDFPGQLATTPAGDLYIAGTSGLNSKLGAKFTFITNACRIPDGGNSGVTQICARSYHVAADDMSLIQLLWANWYLGEQSVGGPTTITASVEYPIGVFNQVKFNGLTSGTIPDGTTIRSDLLSLSTPIPRGASFWVRTYNINASGITFTAASNENDGSNFGTSGIVDLTMSGGSGAFAGGQAGVKPIAILGSTTRRGFTILGDSRAAGLAGEKTGGGDLPDQSGLVGYERFVFRHGGYCNLAVGGETAQQFVTNHAKRLAIALLGTHIVCNYGVNDLYVNNSSIGTLQGLISTIIGYFPGKPTYICTIEPSTTGTFSTIAGQTVGSAEANRITWNDNARSFGNGVTMGMAGYIEVAGLVESAFNSGKWAVGFPFASTNSLAIASGYVITDDGIHANFSGAKLISKATIPD